MGKLGLPFKNIKSYNDSMRKSLNDKLFFLEFLPEDDYTFVDFGCADGSVISALSEQFPDKTGINTYIGYDISKEMISMAKTNFEGDPAEDVMFTSDWRDVIGRLSKTQNKKVLILSSVIHEVYSYGEAPKDIDQFWDRVLNSGFDYICIRDMMPSRDVMRETPMDIYYAITKDTKHVLMPNQVHDFEHIQGSLMSFKNALHFLLKYRWQVNWEREVHENYFPLYVEDLISILSLGKYFHDADTYRLDYFERFQIPYLMGAIKSDFGIEFPDYTHVKAIFAKKYV